MVVIVKGILVQRVAFNRIILDLLIAPIAVLTDLIVLVLCAFDANIPVQALFTIGNKRRALIAIKIGYVCFHFHRHREIIGFALRSPLVVTRQRLVAKLLFTRHTLHFSVIEHEAFLAFLFLPHLAF